MNREQRDRLLLKTIAIDRSFGRVGHNRTHQDMMRITNRLTIELFDTQEELRELNEKFDALLAQTE